MAWTAVMQTLIFRPPSSLFVTAMTAVSTSLVVSGGINEFKGKNMQYSKMMAAKSGPVIPSRVGMTAFYFPAFLFAAASFFLFPSYEDLRFLLVRMALALHFLKRVLETLFVHKFSGSMTLDSALTISTSYFLCSLTMIYTQHLSLGLPEPSLDLKLVGIALFLIGAIGNFYHHRLLATLRKEGEREYKIPKGGLFGLVICPHYLFEVVAFWGLGFMAQTVYALAFAAATTVLLLGRSYATRKWYVSKFEDFPPCVRALIPFIF